MKKILIISVILIFAGCSSSVSNSTEAAKNPQTPAVKLTPNSAVPSESVKWQDKFNNKHKRQIKQTQDDKTRADQEVIYEQLQRDNFRKLDSNYKPSVLK